MSNSAAEKILAELSAELHAMEKEKEALAEKHRTTHEKLRLLRKTLIEVCTHPTVKVDYWFDYHRREDYEDHICTTCGATVKRV